ncbi:MAG: hypothetical protein A2931_01410 [Candidatus Niyogibacteria bacterium RIFCSPLOWO2_01_FULL_45_48]|uniref:YdbS-like PH domain-containing protein n=2 Tax=Parcubacteria group TaxID=1794811 RepID=A0A1G2R6Z9_9BACT|nr:MAG: hypothetical protein A2835_01355 [Candidatus Niyogibacteria bacterium RIFCSPHIGHO2_01_FULL_45_28]OGZ30880.1 MAG: hypothetical protein A2931_01410 [Candidatus Niyogibacteria bacterium RIFCSPLOWO2_01_FULL_45_48]OHA68624.1 MAG: hypothetical protein A3D59_00670 [Candidatus Wildermuthbacteria bacterium RIFCSPHIGHO2_02_FULL_47_17]OHA75905.1 MAG: hypothetical protein A3I38_02970 [Candidatus Wildermuthbacteria bacterium RIFCSPLOWO2_02_FULL_47_10]
MLRLHENEKIIIAFHRHWIVVANKMTFAAALFLPALVALVALPAIEINAGLMVLVYYFIIAYMMVALMIAFVIWFDYYLDIWIVTNERIIDVEQIGMFKREVSEFLLSRVQDITIEIPSFVATLLRYGNIRVQTAGQQSFTAKDVPKPDKIKDIILAEARKANHVRTF